MMSWNEGYSEETLKPPFLYFASINQKLGVAWESVPEYFLVLCASRRTGANSVSRGS